MIVDLDNDLQDDNGNGHLQPILSGNEIDEVPETDLDDDFDSEDDLSLSRFVQSNEQHPYVSYFQCRISRWEQMDLFHLLMKMILDRQTLRLKKIHHYIFQLFFSKSLTSLITEKTNLYYVQSSDSTNIN